MTMEKVKIVSKSARDLLTCRVVSFVVESFFIILSFLLYLVIFPSFLLAFSPFYFYRFLAILLAKLFKPDILQIVNTRDGIVGLDEVTKKTLCTVNVLFVCEGDPDINFIRQKYQHKVMEAKNSRGELCYGKLRWYYESWLGFFFWKQEDNFKLESHLRFFELSEICGEAGRTREEDFLKILPPLTTRPFPPKVSPWEILIIPNYVPAPAKLHTDYAPTTIVRLDHEELEVSGGRKFAMVLRFHHALGDGYSLLKLLLHNWCDVPLDKLPGPSMPKMTYATTVLMYARVIFLSPYYQLRQWVIDVDRNLWHSSKSQLAREWFVTHSEKVSLNKIRAIALEHGVSVTAVLLGGLGGGIRNYLKESGQGDKIPGVMRALIPMPWKGHPMDTLVNHWTLGTVAIPVGLDSPHDRLKAMEGSLMDLKYSPILITNFVLVPLFLGLPIWLTDILGKNWFTTINLSNFPGPDFMTKMFETYPAHDCISWLPQMRGDSAMGVNFIGYNGGVRIAATVDKSNIPDSASAAKLSSLINEEYHNLHTLSLKGEPLNI